MEEFIKLGRLRFAVIKLIPQLLETTRACDTIEDQQRIPWPVEIALF